MHMCKVPGVRPNVVAFGPVRDPSMRGERSSRMEYDGTTRTKRF